LAFGLNERGTIAPYDALKKATEGLNHQYQAHHIVEDKILEHLRYPSDQCPAVVLTAKQHTEITAALNKVIPKGKYDAPRYDDMTERQILRAYQIVYKDHPEWLAVVEPYFK